LTIFQRFSKIFSWVSNGIWIGVGVDTETRLGVGLKSDMVGVINGDGIGVFVAVKVDEGFPE
jgi:hypothetical protein